MTAGRQDARTFSLSILADSEVGNDGACSPVANAEFDPGSPVTLGSARK
jgi:hypothetical protein